MWQRAAGGHTDWQGLSQPLYDLLPDGKMYHAVQWDICPGITGRRDQRERYNPGIARNRKRAFPGGCQGFYWYLKHRDDPWKYENIAEKMRVIVEEDECNDTYERCRMNQALKLKYPNEDVPSERTVYRIMERIGLSHRPNRKPHGITKADRNARKSENLLNRDFRAGSPLKKCVTDITEIPAKNGKLYVSAIFDCYDLDVLGLSMSDNMKTELCTSTIENMVKSNPSVCGMILHSDRGSQYTSASYRAELSRHGIIQSMNSDGAMIMHAVRLCGQE